LIEREVASALDDVGPGARATLTALPEDELWALRPDFDSTFIDYLEHQREAKSYQEGDVFVDLYYRYLRFLDAMALCNDEAFDQCVESRPGDNALRILCKDPSAFIGRTINRSHTTIGLSATLSPSEFYLDLLGFDRRRTVDISIPSPFPEENRRVVIDPTIATTYLERPRNYARIAERLTSFAQAVPGNCMALFPSYKFLSDVAERIEIKGKILLVQKSTDGEPERQAVLGTLRSPLAGEVLLLAVAGGVFAEGVDYPGDMLSAVAVVGPCLPGLTLEQTRLKEYFQDRFERGFEYSFVVPGMTRVVQAVGRLIRSADDTGVIALLDHRFLDSPYREFLPKDWLPIEGPDGLIGDPAEVAQAFFSERRAER
jgi:DNA excision repair protein ERCC-2